MVIWLDTRGAYQKPKLEKDPEFNKIFPGILPYLPPQSPVLMADLIKELEPEFEVNISKETTLWGNVDTWLAWKLTGGKTHATVPSVASVSMLYTERADCWNKDMVEYMGLSVDKMPVLKDESDDFGMMTEDVLGIPVPIYSLVADQQSALISQACFKENIMKCTIGTGTFIDINIGTEAKQVPRPRSVEATALGAAELSAIRCGWFTENDLEDFLHIDKRFEPTEKHTKAAEEFLKWKNVVSRALNFNI